MIRSMRDASHGSFDAQKKRCGLRILNTGYADPAMDHA
jgi:hypothetical protein